LLCLIVVLAAMGWISVTARGLDEAEVRSRHQAVLEENVRLALWRIDSALSPILAQESARPYFAYKTFVPFGRAFAQTSIRAAASAGLVSSPLSAATAPYILIHFQFEPDGQLTSPGVPSAGAAQLAIARGLMTDQTQQKAREQLQRVRTLTTRARLMALLPASPPPPPRVVIALPSRASGKRQALGRAKDQSPQGRGAQEFALRSQTVAQNSTATVQSQLATNGVGEATILNGGIALGNGTSVANKLPVAASSPNLGNALVNGSLGIGNVSDLSQVSPYANALRNAESSTGNVSVPLAGWNQEQTLLDFAIGTGDAPAASQGYFGGSLLPSGGNGGGNRAESQQAATGNRFDPLLGSTDLGGVLMTPLWIDGELLLVRRIAIDGQEYVQGCLLDWAAIKTWLLETVSDLLPEADLRPVPGGATQDESRMLAALPVRLVSGPPAWYGPEPPSPIRWILPVAWGGVLLAAAAVAALLANVLRLSERRVAFVSAVTHELRTPLTTFHMYTEMLSEGMVRDPEQRRQYLNTLRAEAARLSHLVENVLAYARLERRRVNDTQPVALAKIVTACRERLAERAVQAGMELLVEADDDSLAAVVQASPSVVEQILVNLVDNACKYASQADDKRMHVTAARCDAGVRITVRDHGPGLPRPVARKLFRPFSKSAQEAANSAPGIGLGLALSKRLARDMGGRLTHDPTVADGTAFVLLLPLARGKVR
jgi:signal transduction histidine kinase